MLLFAFAILSTMVNELSNNIVLRRRLRWTDFFLKVTQRTYCTGHSLFSGYIRECTSCIVHIWFSCSHSHFHLFGICSLHLLQHLHILSEREYSFDASTPAAQQRLFYLTQEAQRMLHPPILPVTLANQYFRLKRDFLMSVQVG